MKNLYSIDYSDEKQKAQKAVVSIFESCYQKGIFSDKDRRSFPNKINLYVNLSSYQYIRNVKNIFCDLVNQSFSEYHAFLDLSIDMNNLHAIIVDTSWYNWFPNYIEGVSMPAGYQNCYIVIYNEDEYLGEHIFDHCTPFSISLPLKNALEHSTA